MLRKKFGIQKKLNNLNVNHFAQSIDKLNLNNKRVYTVSPKKAFSDSFFVIYLGSSCHVFLAGFSSLAAMTRTKVRPYVLCLKARLHKSAVHSGLLKARLNQSAVHSGPLKARLHFISVQLSSETQGQLVGRNEVNRAEIVAAKVFKKSGKSPWETSLSAPFPNGSANAGF